MPTITRPITVLGIAGLLISGGNAVAQKKSVPVCTQTAFAGYKPLPRLEYECPESLIDSDNKILKLAERLAAVKSVVNDLESFADAAWWQVNVDDLSACELHGRAGALTDEEKEEWRRGDYRISLFGNHQMRLALLSDPCYQTGFNGSNAFLLYRRGDAVYVTQVLNGYYSRVDNSVGINFANLNGQQLIEVSTANNMPPGLTYYYFVIDAKTNQAIPKKLFKEGAKLTNEIYSAMLFSEPKDLGELKLIRNNRLAPTFSVYEESENGKIDDNGRKLRRIIYRWNGQLYVVQNRKR